MKIFVARVITEQYSDRVAIPQLSTRRERYVPGEAGTTVKVELHALVESEADADAWRSAVGKTLSVYEPDLVPGAPDD